MFELDSPRDYLLPVMAAATLHALLALLVLRGWEFSTDTPVIVPKSVQASLVTLEKPAARPRPQSNVKPKVRPKTPAKPKPKPIDTSAQEAAKAKALAEAERKAREAEVLRERQEQLEKQREQQLDRLLAEEEDMLQADAEHSEIARYQAIIRAEVISQWSRPPSARRDMVVVLQLQLVPSGDVVNVRVKQSSGHEPFDRSAELAVQKVERFAALRDMPSQLFERHFRSFSISFRGEDLRL